ncbi:HDOD domain-containing protein [Alishewanella sp. d11]|uniref:HDOD domain-containing protein n=1 Tax=Alishewanella sp. d11 TaxID=3414030 RepID=UPI003BF8794D
MNFNVLFIDDDAFMLKALIRTAKRLRPTWTFLGCEMPENWHKVGSTLPSLDMVICDYQMPSINGEQVLRQVMQACPAAVRVLLTGDSSEEIVTRASQFSHHIVGKPFSEQAIQEIFHCLERLQRLPFVKSSREQLGKLQGLPVLPDLVNQIRVILHNPEADLLEVASLLEHEPALSARLVPLANSAFMGFARPVTNIMEAVLRLGSKLIEAIVILHSVEREFSGKLPPDAHIQINEFAFKHAVLAKKLASYSSLTTTEQDMVFSAAIFSAIGRLIESVYACQEEHEYNANIHIQPGFLNSTLMSAYILTLWGHDEMLCEVLLWQDTPSPEGNSVEQLSFILFLTKQFLVAKTDEDINQLQDIIESPVLLAAWKRLTAEIPIGSVRAT